MTRSIDFAGVRLDVALVLAALCACLGGARLHAAESIPEVSRTTLVVRVYDSVGLDARDLREANRVASGILHEAGIDVEWKRCVVRQVRTGSDVCGGPLGQNEAVLRLIPAADAMSAEPATLGFTALDGRGRRPVLTTIFMDRVALVAQRAKVDETLLAGRAMAHELGHLLLGSAGHASDGLMRAYWSDEDLRSPAGRDWWLLPSEVDAIRRLQQPQAPILDVTGGS